MRIISPMQTVRIHQVLWIKVLLIDFQNENAYFRGLQCIHANFQTGWTIIQHLWSKQIVRAHSILKMMGEIGEILSTLFHNTFHILGEHLSGTQKILCVGLNNKTVCLWEIFFSNESKISVTSKMFYSLDPHVYALL